MDLLLAHGYFLAEDAQELHRRAERAEPRMTDPRLVSAATSLASEIAAVIRAAERLQAPLHVDEEAGERSGRAHCGRPSPGSTGVMPRSASRAATRRLPVWIQRS